MGSADKLRIAIISLCPNGVAASHRYRFEQYIPALERKGFIVRQYAFYSRETFEILYTSGNTLRKSMGVLAGGMRRVVQLFRVWRYDYVFVHREATPVGPPWFEYLIYRFSRGKLIFDFDDAIWITATSKENAISARLKWTKKIPMIFRWSDRLSCGNSYLAQHAKKYNDAVTVNPTTIDTQYHVPRRVSANDDADRRITIGWTGSHSTLKYLLLVEPVLLKLSKEFDFELVVIADRPPPFASMKSRLIRWSLETEIEDLQTIDIGLMPLSDDVFERGKCGFKALQYMAIEVPALVSPVGVNTEIVRNGIDGYHCVTDEDWETGLRCLLQDSALRKKMGKSGRQRVIEHYSVDSNTQNVISLFDA